MWAWLLSAKGPEVSLFVLIGGISVIGIVWLRNHLNEVEGKRRREERDRERVKSIRDNFQKLQLRIITDSDHHPFAFQSLFDATRSFPDKPYSYPKVRELHFVVNGIAATSHDLETVTAFLSEFYDLDGHSVSDKKPIHCVEESEDSRIEKARLQAEREAQRQRVLEIALADIDGRAKEDVGEAGSAVYIMVSRFGAKIGISDEPERRLGQVQTGHPATVSLSKVIWFFSREDAMLVENTVHDLLKLQGAHASGEWFHSTGRCWIRR